MIPLFENSATRSGCEVLVSANFRKDLADLSTSKLADAAVGVAIELNQQFVGENTQAIDRCGFHSQDDRAERNWLAAMTTRERKFRGCEIAFWPNKHQDPARRTLMFIRVVCENLL